MLLGERAGREPSSEQATEKNPSCNNPGHWMKPPIGNELRHRTSAVVVLAVTGSQKSIQDHLGDLAAQALARGEVEAEMLSGKDAAHRRLPRGVSERIERALHPSNNFGGAAEGGRLAYHPTRE